MDDPQPPSIASRVVAWTLLVLMVVLSATANRDDKAWTKMKEQLAPLVPKVELPFSKDDGKKPVKAPKAD